MVIELYDAKEKFVKSVELPAIAPTPRVIVDGSAVYIRWIDNNRFKAVPASFLFPNGLVTVEAGGKIVYRQKKGQE